MSKGLLNLGLEHLLVTVNSQPWMKPTFKKDFKNDRDLDFCLSGQM